MSGGAFTADRPAARLTRLPPDSREIAIAMTATLPICPFCGASPIAFVEENTETKLFVGRVACTRCHCGMHYCGRTREEAREGAIADWRRRHTSRRGKEFEIRYRNEGVFYRAGDRERKISNDQATRLLNLIWQGWATETETIAVIRRIEATE